MKCYVLKFAISSKDDIVSCNKVSLFRNSIYIQLNNIDTSIIKQKENREIFTNIMLSLMLK